MGSVQPIVATDLNGIELNPGDIVTDELVGYVGYVRNLCTDLGTEKDDPEAYQDYLNFTNELKAARISTFEPDAIDKNNTFENLDLTGENVPVMVIPNTYYMMFRNQILFPNNGVGYTPFDTPNKNGYFMSGEGLSPFDACGSTPSESVVLTA